MRSGRSRPGADHRSGVPASKSKGTALAVQLFLLCNAAFGQDSGQLAAALRPMINGTLPIAAQFQAQSSVVNPMLPPFVLTASPQAGQKPKAPGFGILQLGLSTSGRDGYVFIPPQYSEGQPRRFIVGLHAAGKGGLDALGVLLDQANATGVILLAPESRGATWQLDPSGNSTFGMDAAFISAAMNQAFAILNVNTSALGMQGFSDGATMALALGMTNGELFSKVMANSPGGLAAQLTSGRPPVFISAGLQDDIFPVQQAANPVVCSLNQLGYTVTYVQFQGKHEMPFPIRDATMDFFLGSNSNSTQPSGICQSA